MSAPPLSIPVVCALIERNGRVLVAQRPAHKHLGLKWEFPGGKVETGEDPRTALTREIIEELDCVITALEPLPSSLHHYDAISVEMQPFIARLAMPEMEPHPREHVAVRWVDPADLLSLDLAPADVPIVQHYLNRKLVANQPSREA